MTASGEQTASPGRRRIVAGGVGLAVAALAVYAAAALRAPPGEAACRPAQQLAQQKIAPLIHGEVAALAPAREAQRVPDIAFSDAQGAPKTLADWRRRSVLLNLWATWCVPCRKEMPALDALQEKLGGPDFEVVAINIDTRDPQKPRAWLQEAGVTRLGYYADPSAKVFQDLKSIGRAFGMPTTLLIDPAGCEIASLAGPAEWASEDGVAVVKAALGR